MVVAVYLSFKRLGVQRLLFSCSLIFAIHSGHPIYLLSDAVSPLLADTGQSGNDPGPEVGFGEIAIDLLQARFGPM
jgi:hypothetical protein